MSQKVNKSVVSLAPVIAECERILREAIAHFELKTKPESIVVTIQTKGRAEALGWFWAGRWSNGKNEINLSAETLRKCHPGEVLIHELAHAENNTLGIKDCSGKAHNKHFKTMAERLGLKCAEKRDKRYGWGLTDLDKGASDFLAKVKYDNSIFALNRLEEGKTSKAGTRLLKAECPECGYTVRVTQKWIDVGMPTCPCGQKMEGAA
jgi:ssDNA-binding Zn-finger/Zn-ribbon topoisomerase 1